MVKLSNRYNLRKRNANKKKKFEENDEIFDSSDSEKESINSDDISSDSEDDDNEDGEIIENEDSLDLIGDNNLKFKLQISILKDLLENIKKKRKFKGKFFSERSREKNKFNGIKCR